MVNEKKPKFPPYIQMGFSKSDLPAYVEMLRDVTYWLTYHPRVKLNLQKAREERKAIMLEIRKAEEAWFKARAEEAKHPTQRGAR